MTRLRLLAAISVPLTSQTPRFEVASVKPLDPGNWLRDRSTCQWDRPHRGAQLRLVSYALGLDPNGGGDYPLPEGGPEWINRELFEVQARGPADLSVADARLMLRTLPEERFKLRVHTVKRELPVYALVHARADRRLGEGLRLSKSDCTKYSETLLRTGRGALAQPEGVRTHTRSASGARQQTLLKSDIRVSVSSRAREGIMNVSLTPELEKFVDDKVESGLYNNASEVVRESLRLLKEHEDFKARARESIERGWLQAQRGELADGPKAMTEARARIKSLSKKRA